MARRACDAEPGNRYKYEAVGKLFASWTEFAKRAGEEPGSVKSFTDGMGRRGFALTGMGHDNTGCLTVDVDPCNGLRRPK